MQFICQINCADLSAYDTPLPKEGLLLFFANIDYYMGYDVEPRYNDKRVDIVQNIIFRKFKW